jgi:hypothetical protein
MTHRVNCDPPYRQSLAPLANNSTHCNYIDLFRFLSVHPCVQIVGTEVAQRGVRIINFN